MEGKEIFVFLSCYPFTVIIHFNHTKRANFDGKNKGAKFIEFDRNSETNRENWSVYYCTKRNRLINQ